MLRPLEVPVGNSLLNLGPADQRGDVGGRLVGIDQRLDQRVRGQPVGAVQPRAGGFAQRIESLDGGLAVAVDLHAAAAVVGGRRDGYPVLGDVDADRETLLVDVGEVSADRFGLLVGDVEIYEVFAPPGHLAVDGAGHHVARSQRLHGVVLVHELLARLEAQDGSEAAHGLRDEEVGLLAGVVEGGGVELDELHVLGDRLRTVAHGYPVARRHDGVRGRGVDVAAAARRHDGELREHGLDLVGPLVEDVGAEAGQPAGVASDELAQMVLRQQVDGEMVLQHGDVRMVSDRLDQCPFDFGPRQILMVEDAVLRVAAFAVELVASVGSLVESGSPFDQVGDQLRSPSHDQLDGLFAALSGAADHRVANVFLECIGGIGDRADTALGVVGVRFLHFALRHDGDVTVGGGLQGEAESGRARADNQKVGFHTVIVLCGTKIQNNAVRATRYGQLFLPLHPLWNIARSLSTTTTIRSPTSGSPSFRWPNVRPRNCWFTGMERLPRAVSDGSTRRFRPVRCSCSTTRR